MSDVATQLLFDQSGNLAVRNVQDVEPILERNKELRAQKQTSDWGRHIAEIPNVIMTRWLNEAWESGNTGIRLFGPEMDAIVAKKLRDPEWAFLRTDSAHVQGWLGFGS